jgi:hypothetical protein
MPFNSKYVYTFTDASIRTYAPNASGVYGLFTNNRWVYVGESRDIQARLLQHLNGDNACINGWNPSSFIFELVSVLYRVQRQNQLILELVPACNQRLG